MVDVGQIISGKYKLLRLLGDGGMGAVYEAEHLGLGTRVAIKVLHADMAHRAGLNERFLQEARVSAQIRSPHVVSVTDVDRTPDGVAYLVMELLHGEPLSNVLRRESRLTPEIACKYTLQILEALEAAHALGVIHRDLKPDNVFVTFEGGRAVLKLIDFGIAKLKREQGDTGTAKNLTVAGMLMGTPEYMAPEQAYAADKVDVRADVYAVGAMLYEMLSGRTPVSGDDPRVVIGKVERGEVVPLVHLAPETPPELAGLAHRAMAPKPELRFASATEMRLAIEAFVAGKRPGTVKLAQAPAEVLALPPIGTGTVMGAPADAVLASAPRHTMQGDLGQGPPPEAFSPMGSPHAPARHAPANHVNVGGPSGHPPVHVVPYALPGGEASRPRRGGRGGKGLIVGLAVLALLLGAGAVVAYVLGTRTPEPVVVTFPTSPTATSPTTPATTPARPTDTAAPPLTGATPTLPTTTPLTPPPQTTATTAPPHTTSTATASATPSTTTTIPPFTFPSALPSGFPSALPSGFPSTLPSVIPLPSGFPQLPWGAPTPAPSSSP